MSKTPEHQLPAKYTLEGEAYRSMCATMNELALRGPHEESLMLRVANAGDIGEVTTVIRKARTMRAKFAKRGRAVEDEHENVTPMPARRRRADRRTPRRKGSRTSNHPPAGAGGEGAPAAVGE